MTKTEALEIFNGSASRLAKALNITRQAVHQWPEEKIPEKQELKIRYEVLPSLRRDAAI